MTSNEQVRAIKTAFDQIASAKGKDKIPLVAATEGRIAGRALLLLLDPDVVFHLGRKSLNKPVNLLPQAQYSNFFALCDCLSMKDGLTDQDIANVQAFLLSLETDLRDFTREFLQKTLKLGVTMKTVRKAYKNTASPHFECMLAKKYFEYPHVVDGKIFTLTEKLDGFRCLAICSPHEEPILLSRQGKQIHGFKDIERELYTACESYGYGFMVDGELLIRNREGLSSKEQYKKTSKIVSRKNGIKAGIQYNAFDIVPLGDVRERMCHLNYGQRRQNLERLFSRTLHVKPVPILYVGGDTGKIWEYLDQERAKNHEGVMINLVDAPYVFGRTTNLLKVKVMQTADLRITGVKEGTGKFAGTLGALIVDYKGTPVGVGSGLSDAMRQAIWNDPDAYIGAVAEIRYFEETMDKNGTPSIRFPVFERIREEGKAVSYN